MEPAGPVTQQYQLVIVPQLPVALRYQEWWPDALVQGLFPYFAGICVLGRHSDPVEVDNASFSLPHAAIRNELNQIDQWLQRTGHPDVPMVLLHCDLSYPGIFHQVLALKRPAHSAVICHASARNRFDVFAGVKGKWRSERAAAEMYDKVLVATHYHAWKLRSGGVTNARVLGALPHPPASIRPRPFYNASNWPGERPLHFVSVARPTRQKVDQGVEEALKQLTGNAVHRPTGIKTWEHYYHFLDRSKFLVITSREETYGYQVVDAVLRGCIPIAPRACSYPELLPPYLLYDINGSALDRARRIQRIAEEEEGKGLPQPHLLCDNAAAGFYENLAKELTQW